MSVGMNSDINRSVHVANKRLKSCIIISAQLPQRAVSRYLFQQHSALTAGHNIQRRSFTPRATAANLEEMGSKNSTINQLFQYTSGRWLWDEEQQLQARYRSSTSNIGSSGYWFADLRFDHQVSRRGLQQGFSSWNE